MELEQQSTSDEVVTQAASTEPAAESAATEAAPEKEQTLAEKITSKGTVAPSAGDKAAEIAAYNANLKFYATVLDEDATKKSGKKTFARKEFEVPELLKGVVKDEKAEKYVKDILERSYGIDSLKDRHTELKSNHEQLQQTYGSIMSTVETMREAYKKGDLDTVFESLTISPEKVLQWAVQKVELSQLPHEQRRAYEEKVAAEKRAMELERQTQHHSQEAAKTQQQYLSQILDMVLERPDYGAVAQAYDSRKGSQGAFRDLVVRMGQSEFALSGKILNPMEATQKALELLGESLTTTAKPAAEVETPAQQATPQQMAKPEKKVIPNLAGAKASAPAKKKISSLDDIKKARDAIMNN